MNSSVDALVKDILRIDTITCRHLWKMRIEDEAPSTDAPKLLFPLDYETHTTSVGTKRVSEQEARFAFVHALDAHRIRAGVEWYYSVETPTLALHRFTGDKDISGNIDLSVYQPIDQRYQQICNIELKANQPRSHQIGHDFLKLVLDEIEHPDHPVGHYFHLIDSANAGTLPALFFKFNEALDHASESLCRALPSDIMPLHFTLVIAICLLNLDNNRGQWACFKQLDYSGTVHNLANHFSLTFNGDILHQQGSLEAQKRYLSRNKWAIIT